MPSMVERIRVLLSSAFSEVLPSRTSCMQVALSRGKLFRSPFAGHFRFLIDGFRALDGLFPDQAVQVPGFFMGLHTLVQGVLFVLEGRIRRDLPVVEFFLPDIGFAGIGQF